MGVLRGPVVPFAVGARMVFLPLLLAMVAALTVGRDCTGQPQTTVECNEIPVTIPIAVEGPDWAS